MFNQGGFQHFRSMVRFVTDEVLKEVGNMLHDLWKEVGDRIPEKQGLILIIKKPSTP